MLEFSYGLWYNITIMNSRFESPNFPDPSGPEVRTILQEQALFLQDVSELMSTIVSLGQTTNERHAFEFITLPFITDFQLPNALKPIAHEIDTITVHIGDSHEATEQYDENIPPFISIDFETPTHTYTLSRAGMDDSEEPQLHKLELSDYRHAEPESNFIKRLARIDESISVEEFNSLLMSIVLPNEAGDYKAYADRQLQSTDAFRSMCELMEKRSMQHESFYELDFQDEESSLYFTKENGQITSFTFSYFDAEQSRPLRVEYDNSSDLNLCFYSEEDVETAPIIPTAKEISYARLVLDKELSHLGVGRFAQLHDGIVEPEGPTAADEEKEHVIKEAVEQILNELGLNPPNTSA